MPSSLAIALIVLSVGIVLWAAYDIGWDRGSNSVISFITPLPIDTEEDFESDDKPNSGEPTGWFIRYNRATDTLHWGPFETDVEAWQWLEDNNLQASIIPMYLDLDWNRSQYG